MVGRVLSRVEEQLIIDAQSSYALKANKNHWLFQAALRLEEEGILQVKREEGNPYALIENTGAGNKYAEVLLNY
jgi:hypothetical protein